MARLLICFALLVATAGVFSDAVGNASKSAPPPGPDCSNVVFDMIDCIDFISVGGKEKAPTASCCQGVKSVIAVSPDCLCAGMVTAASMGIIVDKARAKVLPGDCKIPASSYHECGGSPSPSPVPVPANPPPSPAPKPSPPKPSPPTKPPSPPSSPPPSPSGPTPASPSGGGGAATEVPAPAPVTKSGAHSIAASCLGLLMGLALSASVSFLA